MFEFWKKGDLVRKTEIIIVLILMILVVVFLVLLWSYYNTPEKKLDLAAEIEEFSISGDGKIAYINLLGGSNDREIIEILFTFINEDDGECEYSTEEGIRDIGVKFERSFLDWFFGRPFLTGYYEYEIDISELNCLDNFEDIKRVYVRLTQEPYAF